MKVLQFLIVKTSALGDIIQTFCVLDYLHSRKEPVAVDWVVEEKFADLVVSHPLVRRAILVDLKRDWFGMKWLKRQYATIRKLRQIRYDAVFDLQGNSKSGFWTLMASAKQKVGLKAAYVREWPNVLATNVRYRVDLSDNIRFQYLKVCQQRVSDGEPFEGEPRVNLIVADEEIEQLRRFQATLPSDRPHIMVCPGAKWINKRLSETALKGLLEKIEQKYGCFFLFIWGSEEEKALCERLQKIFADSSCLAPRLKIAVWQRLMQEMDVVIAVDSCALHLCATTATPSFSVFGPTSASVFKPPGRSHVAYQGSCPYGRRFVKQCPIFRTCPSGACIRSLDAQTLFEEFESACFLKGFSEVGTPR